MRYGRQGWLDLRDMDVRTFNRIYTALQAMVERELGSRRDSQGGLSG